MRFRFLYAFWVKVMFFRFLLAIPPAVVFYQEQYSQNFAVAASRPNYCPGPGDAIGTCQAKSRFKCAVECLSHQWCIYFSYYANSGLCYFYRFVSRKIFYDHDCTFMMVSSYK